MNRFLKFASWVFTAVFGVSGLSGLFTPQIGVAISCLAIAVILSPPFGRLVERFSYSAMFRGIAVIALVLIGGATVPSVPETAQSVPVPSTAPVATSKPDCIPAKGLLNAGMKLYLSDKCEKSFATLLGDETKDGERLIRIQFNTGEVELKNPDAVMSQAFVSRSDPKFPKERVD